MSKLYCFWKLVLMSLHYKGQCWCNFSASASVNMASWKKWMLARLQCKWSVNVASCWKSFIKKDKCKFALIDKVMVMLQCKCKSWRSFITKISGDVTSWQTWILAWLQCKWSVDPALWLKKSAVVASLQRWILIRLLGKGECLCNFMEKTTGVAALRRQVWNTFMQKLVLV